MTIIPLPSQMEMYPGRYQMDGRTAILMDAPNQANSVYLRELLTAPTGFPLPIYADRAGSENTIRLNLDPTSASLAPEGYRLEIRPEGVTISAPTTAGVFYGIQSLRQLLPPGIESHAFVSGGDWSLPCVEITDQPRFSWRGFMLDEGRHFHGKEVVLQTLELMALQKLNILHLHLTEDQGWRIEIKKYPKLTEIGSRRAGTSRFMLGRKHDGIPHSGFFTRDDIQEIVAYAGERHITVVPEVEMPGHSLAALASYPEISCTGGSFEVATHFGIFPDIFCAGKESTFTFLQDVLEELLELFPSPYIHIGGDEAPKFRWKKCPDCRSRIRELGLKDEHALQVYFINRIANYLHSKGRHLMGWNDVLQDGLAYDAVVQFWARGRKRLVQAIRDDKRAVVMSGYLDAYLDHCYSLTPLSRAYRYEPILEELDESQAGSILGLEFPLWSEWVPDRPRLDYQAYPRLTAMAETGWTPKARKNYSDFRLRLEGFLPRLDRLGVRYAPLGEAEPSRFRQLFGLFTIARPQTGTSA